MEKIDEAVKNFGSMKFEIDGMIEGNPFKDLEVGIYGSIEGHVFQIETYRNGKKVVVVPGGVDIWDPTAMWLDTFYSPNQWDSEEAIEELHDELSDMLFAIDERKALESSVD